MYIRLFILSLIDGEHTHKGELNQEQKENKKNFIFFLPFENIYGRIGDEILKMKIHFSWFGYLVSHSSSHSVLSFSALAATQRK